MIELKKKYDCCGCGACNQVCPEKCIIMKQDNEGFLYPVFDISCCTDCGLCEEVCPFLNKAEKRKPHKILAVKNKDNATVLSSSSGGVFSILSAKITNDGGFVFGAVFNENWEVIHFGTNDTAHIDRFKTSKYVQSDTLDCFTQIKDLLNSGSKVLFSGTPCQVSALNLFLMKEYDNLITVDFICHGVPSPGIWSKYIDEIIKSSSINFRENIKSINFRDKTNGWRKFSLRISDIENNDIVFESLRENSFLKGFLKDLFLRPSCHNCPSKSFRSQSDITIADFWGIQSILPDFNDDIGISLVTINSGKMENEIIKECSVIEVDDKILKKNYALHTSVKKNLNRKKFFKRIYSGDNLIPLIAKYSKQSLIDKYIRKFSILTSRLLN